MYYGVSICLVSFASGLSVVTLNVYHRGVRGAGVPQLVKTLVLGKLARLVFLQFEPRDKFTTSSSNQQDVNPRTGTRLDCQRPPDKWGSEDTEHLDPQQMSPRFPPRRSHPETSPGPAQDSFEAQFLRMLNKVSHTIERNELRAAARERRDTAEIEWKQVALVCDRFLLWVFLLTTAITTTVILCGSPHGP